MSRSINLNANKPPMVCFVCDMKVAGDRVNLATTLTAHSKVTLPEKISQLVGDDYVVAITEADCACKRCHSLLNHMDKLENELTLVKRALFTNISQKYKISFDSTPAPVQQQQQQTQPQPQQQPLSNGLKTDSASDYEEDSARKVNNTEVTAANATPTPLKKKVTPPAKIAPAPKPTKPPAENVTKLKIYKCGFCSYQSKELGNVRLHMKIHIRANKSDADGDKTATATSTPLVTPKPSAPVRRRVFRCQVCSASFDDRNKCLDHISRDHTAAGRKLVEQKQSQAEQQSQQTAVADAPSDSTSRVEVSSAEQATATPEIAAATTETAAAAAGNDTTATQEGLNNQEAMDTSEPPSIALYSCDSCPSNFNNDVEFANHANDHTETKDDEMPAADAKDTTEEGEQAKAEDNAEFAEMPSQADDAQTTIEDEAPKDDAALGMDIEAMIAALHSEGPEANTESMPNI